MMMTKQDDHREHETKHATMNMDSILRSSVQHVIRNRNTLNLTRWTKAARAIAAEKELARSSGPKESFGLSSNRLISTSRPLVPSLDPAKAGSEDEPCPGFPFGNDGVSDRRAVMRVGRR
jgi:hypothetical protein